MKTTTIFLLVYFCCIHGILAQDKKVSLNSDSANCVLHDTVVHLAVEKNATFQGGDLLKFRDYVGKNIKIPYEHWNTLFQGKTYIQFIVNWDGQVKDAVVYKSCGLKGLDDAALKAVLQSPVWISAKNLNICVPQKFVLPVEFTLLGLLNK